MSLFIIVLYILLISLLDKLTTKLQYKNLISLVATMVMVLFDYLNPINFSVYRLDISNLKIIVSSVEPLAGSLSYFAITIVLIYLLSFIKNFGEKGGVSTFLIFTTAAMCLVSGVELKLAIMILALALKSGSSLRGLYLTQVTLLLVSTTCNLIGAPTEYSTILIYITSVLSILWILRYLYSNLITQSFAYVLLLWNFLILLSSSYGVSGELTIYLGAAVCMLSFGIFRRQKYFERVFLVIIVATLYLSGNFTIDAALAAVTFVFLLQTGEGIEFKLKLKVSKIFKEAILLSYPLYVFFLGLERSNLSLAFGGVGALYFLIKAFTSAEKNESINIFEFLNYGIMIIFCFRNIGRFI